MTALTTLFLILDLESLAALLWAFLTPSESGHGVLLWLAPQRLVLVALLLVIWLLVAGTSIWLWRSQSAASRMLASLDDWLVQRGWLAPALVALCTLPLWVGAASLAILRTPLEYAAYRTWAPDTFPLLRALTRAVLPLLTLIGIASIEAAVFLVVRFRRQLPQPITWKRDRVAPAFLFLLIAVVTALHWKVLFFQLRFLVNIPAWYWIFDPVPFGMGDLWFALGAVTLLGLAYWLLFIRRRIAVGLILVAALGLWSQFGVGLMGGGGLATLRERYFTTYHQTYVRKASEGDLSLLESIRRYEQLYGSNTFTGTKPPGLMAVYIGLDHLVSGHPSAFDQAQRYERLATLIMWLFPMLAIGMVALLWAFARRWLHDASGLVPRLAPLLYVLSPTVALFTFFADQALYPAAFLLGVWFAISAIQRGSMAWGLLLGAALYGAAFFSFSMLPLYPFAGLYLLLHGLSERSPRRTSRVIVSALAIAAGTLALHFLSRALLNYDFLPRFQHSMRINHNFDFYLRVGEPPRAGPEPVGVRLGQILTAAWVNNLDYALAIGFPIYVLFCAQALRRLLGFFRGSAGRGDIMLLALLGSFLLLNLGGTAQGEVPRLWLFWLPMVVLLAAYELEPHVRKHPKLILFLGAAQLITLMLTFHFQDLKM